MTANDKTTPDAHPTADASTVSVFQDTWAVYRKVVDNNYLFHREAYAALRAQLTGAGVFPFRFLDIACGDATASVDALRGTQLTHYHGIDFSSHALQLAAAALGELGCSVKLEEGDFLDLVPERKDIADIIWMGLSLHHLQQADKLNFMRDIRSALEAGGAFLIYENSLRGAEDRDSWMRRWDEQRPAWTAFSDAEWVTISNHVHAADYPESHETWHRLGREAGFRSSAHLLTTPTELFSLYRFDA
ncbi:class I SAM-dependent methyltransferase [Devosia sp. CN2-171]|uniref:class I SAM-dependent methyltransferase n=1 Tax=Devosia sp. CN2-171 TaxID=3400909 RepID=UPI003BF8908A